MKKKKKKNVGAEFGNGLLPKLCSDQGARQLGAGRWAQARVARRWARRRRRPGVRGKVRRGAERRWAPRRTRGEREARGRDARKCAAGTRGSARQGRAEVRGTGAGRAAWACYWPAGCALGALNLLLTRFDSVLFLSQFLDIVREPGS